MLPLETFQLTTYRLLHGHGLVKLENNPSHFLKRLFYSFENLAQITLLSISIYTTTSKYLLFSNSVQPHTLRTAYVAEGVFEDAHLINTAESQLKVIDQITVKT